MTSTALTSTLAPYVAIMEQEITADLASVVSAEKLQDEVRKALVKEITGQAQHALNELIQAVSYYSDSEHIEKAETKAARFVGYVTQILEVRRSQKLLAVASVVEEDQDND